MRVPVHFCPFCRARLNVWDNGEWTTYGCDKCNDEFPNYQVNYFKYPTRLMSLVFTLDKYYINISYVNGNTIISKLEACFLMDSIQIERTFAVDFNNLQDFLAKVKTFLIFS